MKRNTSGINFDLGIPLQSEWELTNLYVSVSATFFVADVMLNPLTNNIQIINSEISFFIGFPQLYKII